MLIPSFKPITAGPTGPTRVQRPATIKAKQVTELDDRVSKTALPAISNFSEAVASLQAAGRRLLNAVLFVPRLICSTIAKTVRCALSCLITSIKADDDTASVESESTTGSRESPLLKAADQSPAEAETLEEYLDILKAISQKTKEERTEVVGRQAIDFRALENGAEKPILHQVAADLKRTVITDNRRMLFINDTRFGMPRGLSEKEGEAAAIEMTQSIKTRIDSFYQETQPDLSAAERQKQVLLVMDHMHQGSCEWNIRKIHSLANWDRGYVPLGNDAMSVLLDMDKAHGTVKVTNIFAKGLLTSDAAERRAFDETFATAISIACIDISHPDASTLVYDTIMN